MASQHEIIELIGHASYLKLARKLPGQRVYIPARLSADSELVQILGWSAAKLCSESLGGEVVHIPRAEVLKLRNTLITALRISGRSVCELSELFSLRERTVRLITQNITDDEREFYSHMFVKAKSKNDSEAAKNQIELFEKEKM